MFEVETVSLKLQRASQDVQRWELNFGVVGTADTQVDLLVNSVLDVDVVDTMVMPQLPAVDTRITVSTTSVPVGSAATAGTSVVYGTTVAVSGLLPKGSFIKFSNHDKLYMVTADADFNLGSNAPINIFPKLQVALTTSHTVKTGSAAILTYYRSIDNTAGITFTDGVLSSLGSITLIEAL
jgi:hypothetical protein